MRQWLAMAITLLAAGCGGDAISPPVDHSGDIPRWADVGKTCTDQSPAVPLAPSKVVSFSHGSDDRWAAISRDNPGGFAGIIVNSSQQLVVLMTDTTQRAAVFAALQANGISTSGATVRQVRWSFAQLFDWLGYVDHALPPGFFAFVTTVDIDEANNRLTFGISANLFVTPSEGELATLDLPCRLVYLEVVPPPFLAAR
jgi:hypothetical protein